MTLHFLPKWLTFTFLLFSLGSFAQQTQIDFTPANNGQTFSTCSGFIIDSGGQGGTGYSNNETTVITICPNIPGEIISVVFNFFNLDLTDDNPAPNVTNVDVMNVYDGTSTAANSLGSYNGNQLQGVVIEATALNASGCITLEFISNTVGTGSFTASVACETPCNDPQAGGFIVGGLAPDSIRVCVGDVITFQEQGSIAQPGFNLVSYDWDFMDGTTANGQTVTHSYSTPGQYRVQLFVTDDNGCSNPNLIDLEVLVGTMPDFSTFPSDTNICLGESMTFVADPQTYQVQWTGFPGSQSVDDGCLPDTLLGVSQDIQLLQTGFSAGSTINNVNDIQSICLDLEHSFMGDLVIIIECPNAQQAILHQQGGGGTQIGIPVQADNVDCTDPATMGTPFTYCFTPTATETWVEWVNNNPGVNTIPAGDYEPIDPLTNLIGCPANGVWTLTVIDNWAADDGTLFSFGLNLDPSFYPAVTTFEPQIGANSDSSYWVTPAPHMTSLSADGNTINLTPTAAGTFNYQYVVVDDFGCVNDTSVNLTVDPNPQVLAGNDTTICFPGPGGTAAVQLNGSGVTSSCDYTLVLEDNFGDGWNGNTITVTINGVSTDYTLNAGSTQSFPISVPDGTPVTITFNANGAFVGECFYSLLDEGGTAVLNQGPNLPGAQTDNVTVTCPPDFVIEWTPAAPLDDASILDPTATLTASETFTVTAYPLGHPLCATSDDVTVTLSVIPDAGLDSTASFCSTGAASDLFPLLGPNADNSGNWFDPNGAQVAMPYDPTTMPPGDYWYVVDANGCFDSARVIITHVVTDITLITPTNVSCNGAGDGSITFEGVNFDSYTVNGGATVVAGSPVTLNGLAPGDYTIVVTSNDGCSDTETVTITEPEPLTATATPTDASCFGVCDGQVQVNVNGGTTPYNYAWLQGVTGDQNGLGTGICAGTYQVDITDANGCQTDVTYEIDEPANVIITVAVDTNAGCYPHQVDFTNTTVSNDIVSTTVDFGDGSSGTFQGLDAFEHTYDSPGIFDVTLTLTTVNGCVYTHTFTELVEAYNHPNANFFVNPDNISMLEPITNLYNSSSASAITYEWTIYNGTPATSTSEDVEGVTYPFDAPGLYPVTLEVTDANGCMDSIQKYVTVINDVILYAPNAFTPDGDEHNQNWEFHISGIDIYDFTLRIFNRWGEQVWESHDPSIGWDGTYNGRVVETGLYNWTMECADSQNDKRYTFTGHINVLK